MEHVPVKRTSGFGGCGGRSTASNKQWKIKLGEAMKCLGFVNSAADDCLYMKRTGERVEVLVLVYVDDMVIAAMDIQIVLWFKGELGKAFQISDLGELKHILGIQIQHDRAS